MLRFRPSYTRYLEEKQLENLRLYKYAAVDKSPISNYVLKHYWNFVITLFPKTIAPNLITLIGLFFMVANVILIGIFSPDLSTTAPNWINFSFAAGLWLYSTFDNVDGRQARRTGTSSPLGELFDHGCDAINCTYVALLQTAALGLGHSSLAAVLLFISIAGFYISTAEEYYTGVLYLGYVNGPTEGIIVTCLAFLWSGVYGVASWHVKVTEVSCLSWAAHFLPVGTTFADLFVWGMALFFFLTHLPMCIYSISKACKEKGLSQWKVFSNEVLFPILSILLLAYCWLSSPASTIFEEKHFILFSLYLGFLFGEMASDIILAHLTKSSFPRFRTIILALAIPTIAVNLNALMKTNVFPEYYILLALCGITVIHFLVRAVRVISAFCDYLGIRCLVIPKQRNQSRQLVPNNEDEQEAESLLIAQEEGIPSSSTPQYNTFQ